MGIIDDLRAEKARLQRFLDEQTQVHQDALKIAQAHVTAQHAHLDAEIAAEEARQKKAAAA